MNLLGGYSLSTWALFHALIFVFLALDLGVFHRKAHVVTFKESLFWNVVWTGLGLGFGGFVVAWLGPARGAEYFTGYLIERALSVDNIFVFVVVFRYFSVPGEVQHRVLYWGILGALLMRGALIFAGLAIISLFHGLLYVFGAFLIFTGIQLLWKQEEPPHPERNPVVRFATRLFPVEPKLHGQRFLVRVGGRWHATPLFVVLLVVETTDLLFALDSIPAIFGVTLDPFIIYSSNVFAILGLRAMYFLIAAVLPRFRYLNHGLSAILVFIGVRMLSEPWVEIPTGAALTAVGAILVVAVVASLLPQRNSRG